MATTFGQQRDPVQLFEQVATLIRENRLAEAEKELAAVLKVTPNLPVALNFMGTIRAQQGRLLEAETLFLRAVRNDKNFTGARMNLVYLYHLQRAPEKAILQLREVLAVEPEHAEASEKLAELLFTQSRFDECISLIENHRGARPVPASLLVILGDAYLAKNDLRKAEENYLVALEGRLENAGALFGLAQLSRIKGETKEASIYLNRVATLTADSKSPEFLYRFGLEAMRVEMFDEAKSALQRAVELRPRDPAYLLALGIAWLRKTDLFEAEKLFRRVLQIQPGNAQGQLHLGYLLINEKKFDEARLWLEKSVRSGVDIPEVFYYLGLVAQEQNDNVRAIALFQKAVQKLPTYVHARVALGTIYMRLKDYARARQELELAVKLDPNEPSAHYNLALLYARTKEPDKAQEQMRIVESLKTGRRSTSGVVLLPPGSSPN
ncbi:MAG TPA: tetratricopeptide repeat protein [Pyrinomonadaceae bacterium]